ncbi:MAG: hypothetical protein C4576_04135 [Desulfobacteraceae bacterium]|nr:MAG: hypothetical protein C4576_04135 [Desulfobacteraceae bacterium]
MKTMLFFALLALFSFFVGISRSPADEPAPSRTTLTYSNCIERLIARCNAKADLGNSHMTNVKQAAALYWLKARFLENLKDELSREMLGRQVGEKQYQIEHYVNHRFFELLRTATAKNPGMPDHGNSH